MAGITQDCQDQFFLLLCQIILRKQIRISADNGKRCFEIMCQGGERFIFALFCSPLFFQGMG